jgi:predicted ATPase/DNA-binding SARP family transcriptional activator
MRELLGGRYQEHNRRLLVPWLRLSLLGLPRITLEETPVKLLNKALALLAYLALERDDPHRRGALVGLLWPELPEDAARNNLRVTLHRLGQALGRPPGEPLLLHSTRDSIQWNPANGVWLDVATFQDLLGAKRPPDSEADAWRLVEAVSLYRGDFLKDFYLEDSAAFEEWALTLRERLKRQALDALALLTDWHLAHGDTGPAQAHARRQIELEPWSEPAHRQLMLALARSGQRHAALAHYETLQRILDDELGVAPGVETTTLYQRLRGGDAEMEARRLSLAPTSQLSVQAPLTPFIGREAELAVIAGLLADPACRLITLLGSGGIGKTRLALQTAQAAAERGACCFVPLAGIEALDYMVPSLASALGLDFSRADDLPALVLQHLRERQLLLVLDNFEQLLGEPPRALDLLLNILHTAPNVKLLVTSRVPLDLQAEVILDVAGLSTPETETAPDVAGYGAVRLFVDRARRVQPHFTLSAANQPWVARICQVLEGLPLGIELAAAWVRVYPCDEIYRQLRRNRDFLITSRHDVPARHRSLRAVFDNSWNLLSEAEQEALRRVAVFQGGFRARAAARVTGAPLAVLLTLLNKSLLRQTPAGRFELHMLVQQYAEEKLQADPEDAFQTQARHARYFAAFLSEREAGARHCDRHVIHAIADELQNVRAAWHWAVMHQQLAGVAGSLPALFVFFDILNRSHEGLDLLGQVEAALQQPGAAAAERALLGQVLAQQGALYNRLSRYREARERLRQSLTLLRQDGSWADIAFALHTLGWTEYLTARYADAHDRLMECLALRRTHADCAGTAEALYVLGYVYYGIGDYGRLHQVCTEGLDLCRQEGFRLVAQHCNYGLGLGACARGEYEQARQYHQEVFAFCESIGFQWGMVWGLHNLSLVAYRQGAYAAAEALTQQSLRIARAIHSRWGIAYGLNALGAITAALGREDEATAYAQESLDLYTAIEDLDGVGVASSTLGELAFARRDDTAAAEHFRMALRMTQETGAVPKALDALVGMAMLRARQGQVEQAVTWLVLARQHPASSHWNRERAAGLLAELAAQLPPSAFTQAHTRGQTSELAEITTEIECTFCTCPSRCSHSPQAYRSLSQVFIPPTTDHPFDFAQDRRPLTTERV